MLQWLLLCLLLTLSLPGLLVAGTPWAAMWNGLGADGCGCAASCAECEVGEMRPQAFEPEPTASCCATEEAPGSEERSSEPYSFVRAGCTCGSHAAAIATARAFLLRLLSSRVGQTFDGDVSANEAWPYSARDCWKSYLEAPVPPPPQF